MANIQELIQRAEAIRDEQSVNANTAERIGSWNLDMALLHKADIKRVIDFMTAETHKYDAAEAERVADEIKRKAAEIVRMQNEVKREKAELLREVKLAEIGSEIGNLAGLNTEDKSNLVNAINEVERKAQGGGSKPVGGWTKTDLSADVQSSLNKADTALQKHQSLEGYAKITDIPTVPTSLQELDSNAAEAIQQLTEGMTNKLNKSLGNLDEAGLFVISNIVSDLIGTAIEQLTNDIAKKVDKEAGKGLSSNDYTDEEKLKLSELETKKQDQLVSGTNIKTINGQAILGEGNIVIQGGEGGGTDENHLFVGNQKCRLITIDRPFDSLLIFPVECGGYLWLNEGNNSKRFARVDVNGDIEILTLPQRLKDGALNMSSGDDGSIWFAPPGLVTSVYNMDTDGNIMKTLQLGGWSGAMFAGGYLWKPNTTTIDKYDTDGNLIEQYTTPTNTSTFSSINTIYGTGHILFNGEIIYDPSTDELYKSNTRVNLNERHLGGITQVNGSVPSIVTAYNADTHTFTTVAANNAAKTFNVSTPIGRVNENCIISSVYMSASYFLGSNSRPMIYNAPAPVPYGATSASYDGWLMWTEDDKVKLLNTLGEWL